MPDTTTTSVDLTRVTERSHATDYLRQLAAADGRPTHRASTPEAAYVKIGDRWWRVACFEVSDYKNSTLNASEGY